MDHQIIADFKQTNDFWKNENLPVINDKLAKGNQRNRDQNASELAYEANIKMPAGKTFLPTDFTNGQITEIIPGRAWVVPNVLTTAECADWIARGEAAGMNKAEKSTLRTNSRTSYYFDSNMSAQIKPKLTNTLVSAIEKSEPGSAVRGIHDNWKIAKYEKGETFPAHYDQDSYQTLSANKDGIKERETSTHTILLYLSNNFDGGATRFFPSGNFENPNEAIDVRLPQGGMLVFEQYGLLHNGMPITDGIKMIAQSAILRAQPDGLVKPAIFRYAPGLKPY